MIRSIADENYGRGFEVYVEKGGWKYGISPTIGLSESIYKVSVDTHGIYDHTSWNSKGAVTQEYTHLQGLSLGISLLWIQVHLYIGRYCL